MGVPDRVMPALLSDRCLRPLNTIILLAVPCGVPTYFFRYSCALLPDYTLGKPWMASSAAAYTARPGDVLELHSRPEEEWRQDGHRTCNCKFWLSERPANRRLHYTALRRRLPPGTGFRRYRSSIWKSTAPVCETFADWPALKAASLK
jgi:hypothetical protein